MATRASRIKGDRQLQQDVAAELNRDWRFRPAEIGVEVDGGVVTLVGTVSSYLKVGQAAAVASRVAGVRDIANKLTVEGTAFADDTKVAQAVRAALALDQDVPDERIDSVVRDGVVTLTGTLEHWSERRAAHDAAARVGGVRHVNSHLVVAPLERPDAAIAAELRDILRRLPFADIEVFVEGAVVTLEGTAATYRAMADAAEAARLVEGVRDVRNRIEVE
ncbi:MAG: BON domain-containing protein [Deltaproteobacteria bacterium]|nr:BON domain-containing protein [Deltaproteobacteria bacterium]